MVVEGLVLFRHLVYRPIRRIVLHVSKSLLRTSTIIWNTHLWMKSLIEQLSLFFSDVRSSRNKRGPILGYLSIWLNDSAFYQIFNHTFPKMMWLIHRVQKQTVVAALSLLLSVSPDSSVVSDICLYMGRLQTRPFTIRNERQLRDGDGCCWYHIQRSHMKKSWKALSAQAFSGLTTNGMSFWIRVPSHIIRITLIVMVP